MKTSVQKTFVIGDEWLYYKIYCGVKTADILLLEIIKPVTAALLKEGIISKWFFIRYTDPAPHIRFRLQLTTQDALGAVILNIKNRLKPYVMHAQIWEVQLASYQREISRYGNHTMEKSEELFCIDSTVILQILENSENDEMRFVHLFKWLTQMISFFNFEDKKLLDFLDSLQTQFKEEFNADKNVRKELSATYRRLEIKLLAQDEAAFLNKNNLKEVVATFLNAEKEQDLEVSLESLLASFIHMSINRCFRSKQRLHEMLLYDFLYKKNKSKFMRYGKI